MYPIPKSHFCIECSGLCFLFLNLADYYNHFFVSSACVGYGYYDLSLSVLQLLFFEKLFNKMSSGSLWGSLNVSLDMANTLGKRFPSPLKSSIPGAYFYVFIWSIFIMNNVLLDCGPPLLLSNQRWVLHQGPNKRCAYITRTTLGRSSLDERHHYNSKIIIIIMKNLH